MSSGSHSRKRNRRPNFFYATIGSNLIMIVLITLSLVFKSGHLGVMPVVSDYFIFPAFFIGLVAIITGWMGSNSLRHRDREWRKICTYSIMLAAALMIIVLFLMLSGGFSSVVQPPVDPF